MLVRMLGPFEVEGFDGAVVVAGASQRVVLALLALQAGRPVSVAALRDALWPDGAPASARNSLQSHVARLRAAIGAPGLITLSAAGYCLNIGRDDVDVLRFEELLRLGATGEALRLWRGRPLGEFDREPFCAIADRLTELHRDAWVSVLEKGGPDDEVRAAAAADPCWERGATALARSYVAAGRRGEALETLRRHADAVVDRLGIDPSETVRQLQVAILRGELTATPAQAAPVRGKAVPLRFSSFLGREIEQRRLADLLAGPGLVTVAGPGGVGKTRLVAETVRAGARVAWVDAADVTAGDFLAAVAVGVGARLGPLDDPFEVIARHAREHSVVVLDNCEHVVDVAAAAVEAMRGVRVVVTSQERLRVDGERVIDLGPLGVQDAARLFRERAGLTDENAVDDIVDRLDRLPLAIELAATQASALGVDDLRERLDDRLDLLVRGRRTGAARHRTLRAVVEWSFALLGERERTVMGGLSAFAGAFTVAQAEAVVPGDDVAAVLASLVDRSLVARHGPGRFRLLETVRSYAAEQRDAQPGERTTALFRRHRDATLAAARRLDREMRGPEQAAAVRELDGLLPDLRSAVARGGRPEEFAAALYRYGYRCQQYEVLAWGRSANTARGPAVEADALAAAATHAWGRGELSEARRWASAAEHPTASIHEVLGDVALVSCEPETALIHYRAMDGEPVHRVSGLVGEALVLAWSGRVDEAITVAGSAVDLARATGNPSAVAEALYGLGETLGDRDPDRALDLLTEAAKTAASVDDRLFLGAAETAAVAIRSRHGDPGAALGSFRDVLTMWRRVGNDTLHAAALPAADVYPAERVRLDRARSAAAERLGAERVEALRQRGALLSPARLHDEASRAIDAALSRIAG